MGLCLSVCLVSVCVYYDAAVCIVYCACNTFMKDISLTLETLINLEYNIIIRQILENCMQINSIIHNKQFPLRNFFFHGNECHSENG